LAAYPTAVNSNSYFLPTERAKENLPSTSEVVPPVAPTNFTDTPGRASFFAFKIFPESFTVCDCAEESIAKNKIEKVNRSLKYIQYNFRQRNDPEVTGMLPPH